jgi:integrase
MSVHRTPQKKYRVKYREGGKQKSATFPTRADAERFDADIKRRQVEGKPVHRQHEAPVLSEFIIDWLAGRTDLTAKTLSGYADALQKHVIPYIGHLRVHGSELRPAVLAEWQRKRLDDGAGASHVLVAHKVLRQILDSAVLPYELLDANPLVPVKQPKLKRKPPRFLRAVDVERIRRQMLDNNELGSATLISILGYVGIRPQDALALEWEHIRQDLAVIQKNVDGKIEPGSKTGQGYLRRVNLPEPVAADLESWRVAQGEPTTGLIFPRAKDGQPWRETDYQNWRKSFQGRAGKANVKNVSPYDLRHTCASLLAAAGWNHLEIARQLGHSPETSVRVYQHLIRTDFGERLPIDRWITEARTELAGEPDVPSKFPQER